MIHLVQCGPERTDLNKGEALKQWLKTGKGACGRMEMEKNKGVWRIKQTTTRAYFDYL